MLKSQKSLKLEQIDNNSKKFADKMKDQKQAKEIKKIEEQAKKIEEESSS